jgi:nicotinamide riboside kinase
MSKVINLYGGPGTGKSTSAAYLFYLLKSQGKNAELVREYVKDWAWEGRNISTYDQIYLLGKQVRRESLLYGKVDYIVTDAPVMLGIYYASKFSPLSVSEGVRAQTLSYYRQAAEDGHTHYHVFLERSKPYNSAGRFQTEDQAKNIDNGVYGMLADLRIPFVKCGTDRENLDQLLTDLKINNPKA